MVGLAVAWASSDTSGQEPWAETQEVRGGNEGADHKGVGRGSHPAARVPWLYALAKHLTHHADKAQGAPVADPVINPVRILARGQDTLVAQDGQML